MYSRGAFSPTTTPAQQSLFRTDAFSPNGNMASKDGTTHDETDGTNHAFGATPADSATLLLDGRPAPAIMIRKLPRTTSDDTLMSMLIFAGDLIDTEFVRSPYPDDHGFATAVARFRSQAGAIDAQQKLNGKTNTTKEANMIVELHSSGMTGAFERRPTIDGASHQRTTGSSSSGTSGATTSRSRFGSTFQSTDKISPPLVTSSSSGSGNDFPVPDSTTHFQTLFSPQSPLANGFDDRHRVSGKSIINDGGADDDETGELLKDPLAYAKNGQKSGSSSSRRPTVPHLPIGRFNSLSLSSSSGSGLPSPTLNGMTSPRATNALQSPLSPTSLNGMPSNPTYSLNYPRPQYPPVNPADQNPPCNTLYVGNLPIDASEDELKAIFSKQRGYKRLCFRTKQNGPMCFVEFEDVSFATKALNELYGHPLHNSVKGGIRLSFSKNPLGVRSGQTSGLPNNNHSNPVSPQGMNAGYVSGMNAGMGFSGVSGPPPGLMAPPGLANGNGSSGAAATTTGQRSPPPLTNLDGAFPNAFGLPSHGFNEQLSPRNLSGGLPPNMSGHYGRDGRAPYNDYMLGR